MLEKYLNFHFDVDGRVAAFKKGMQYSCEIEITNRCCMTCAYCYASANSVKDDLPIDTVFSLVKQLAEYGIQEIGWIGGEPLMHKNLFDFVAMAGYSGMRQVLYTNAVLLEGELRRYIAKNMDRVVVHVDSIDYDVWAKGQVQPLHKTHIKMLKNIVDLVECGFDARKLIVSIPLTRDCFETLEETMVWVARLGVENINLIPLTGIGRSTDTSKFVSPAELKKAMELRSSILRKPFLEGLGVGEYCKQFQLTDFTITYKGDILRYIDDYRPVANIKDGDLKSLLWEHSDALRLQEWVTSSTYGNRIDVCAMCKNKKYCFGNPISRPNPVVGVPDRDCWIVDDVLGRKGLA